MLPLQAMSIRGLVASLVVLHVPDGVLSAPAIALRAGYGLSIGFDPNDDVTLDGRRHHLRAKPRRAG